ncbi:hypothetical protein VKT23_009688 [Stygiomarasmius scandens]|uniref:Uncharacterized protein n=1 Tax=Marasmiellus scandens TaxID=2682957 RepID=A0ABR1JFJ4_9AGAR
MINSAKVFSPRPSPNPLENSRALKYLFKNAAPSLLPSESQFYHNQISKTRRLFWPKATVHE